MEYFTGKFQGRIPITTTDRAAAAVVTDKVCAQWIATFMTGLFGGHEWEPVEQSYEQVYLICR